MTDLPSSRGRAVLELTGGMALAFVTKLAITEVTWKFAGPISLGLVLVILTVYLHRRGEYWTGLGLGSPGGRKSWMLLLPQTLFAVIAILGSGVLVGQAGDLAGLWDLDVMPDGVNDRWGDVQGNLPRYLMWLAIVWTSAAFGEEMFFRAYLISRADRVFAGIPLRPLLAILIPALFFGYGHFYYQGLRGLVVTGVIGLSLGALYLLYKRNLWPLVLAHGLVDTLAFTAMYLDADW